MHHADFVHLHIHTQFSLLDGACRHDQLLKMAHNMLSNPVTAKGRTKGLQALTVSSTWIEPIEEALKLARSAFQSSLESGGLSLGSYGAIYVAVIGFAAGLNLDLYQEELTSYKKRLTETTARREALPGMSLCF